MNSITLLASPSVTFLHNLLVTGRASWVTESFLLDKADRRLGAKVLLLVRHPNVLVLDLTDRLHFFRADTGRSSSAGHSTAAEGIVADSRAFSVEPASE